MIMQYYPDKTLVGMFVTVRAAADSLGSDKDRYNHIRDAVKGRRKSAYGYLWSDTLLQNNTEKEATMKVFIPPKTQAVDDAKQFVIDSLGQIEGRHKEAVKQLHDGTADEVTAHYAKDIALLLAIITTTNKLVDLLREGMPDVQSEQTTIHPEGDDKEADNSTEE